MTLKSIKNDKKRVKNEPQNSKIRGHSALSIGPQCHRKPEAEYKKKMHRDTASGKKKASIPFLLSCCKRPCPWSRKFAIVTPWKEPGKADLPDQKECCCWGCLSSVQFPLPGLAGIRAGPARNLHQGTVAGSARSAYGYILLLGPVYACLTILSLRELSQLS